MPTPFEESNYKYVNKLGVYDPNRQQMSAAARKATSPLRSLAEKMAQGVQAARDTAVGRFNDAPPAPSRYAGAQGQGGLLNDIVKGGRIMGGQIMDAGREVGGILQKINRGPHGNPDGAISILDPNRRSGAQASTTPGVPISAQGPSRIADPAMAPGRVPNRPPSDQGEPAAPQPGAATAPATKPPQMAQGGPSKYLEMYKAGPDAQNKYIKDANLIHMIRGTNQTWARPETTGNEFGTQLEAAAGVTHQNAMGERLLEHESKLANIKAEAQRYQLDIRTDDMGRQIPVVLDRKTGQLSDDPKAAAAKTALEAMIAMKPAAQQKFYNGLDPEVKAIVDQLLDGDQTDQEA